VHPPRDYVLFPDEQGAVDVLLRINCGAEQGVASSSSLLLSSLELSDTQVYEP